MNRLPYIMWSEKNDLGINIVDEQHRSLVSIINTLHFFDSEDQGAEMLVSVKKSLKGYIDIHFKTEDLLMRAARFPGLEQHIEQHQILAAKTSDVLQKAEQTKNPKMALSFLKGWWLEHINIEDRKFSIYLRNKDIDEPPK